MITFINYLIIYLYGDFLQQTPSCVNLQFVPRKHTCLQCCGSVTFDTDPGPGPAFQLRPDLIDTNPVLDLQHCLFAKHITFFLDLIFYAVRDYFI